MIVITVRVQSASAVLTCRISSTAVVVTASIAIIRISITVTISLITTVVSRVVRGRAYLAPTVSVIATVAISVIRIPACVLWLAPVGASIVRITSVIRVAPRVGVASMTGIIRVDSVATACGRVAALIRIGITPLIRWGGTSVTTWTVAMIAWVRIRISPWVRRGVTSVVAWTVRARIATVANAATIKAPSVIAAPVVRVPELIIAHDVRISCTVAIAAAAGDWWAGRIAAPPVVADGNVVRLPVPVAVGGRRRVVASTDAAPSAMLERGPPVELLPPLVSGRGRMVGGRPVGPGTRRIVTMTRVAIPVAVGVVAVKVWLVAGRVV